jgi:transglutaminase-like putative cysteine protease
VPAGRKAERILRWVNGNIEFGGPVVGSRYGTKQVLAQGHGHCWDTSDVFITLCRAAGIPARQVGGWLVGVCGHIWAEVYLPGEGWVAVDSTASWLGVSSDYIPLFISEDGEAPFVYWNTPTIERVNP